MIARGDGHVNIMFWGSVIKEVRAPVMRSTSLTRQEGRQRASVSAKQEHKGTGAFTYMIYSGKEEKMFWLNLRDRGWQVGKERLQIIAILNKIHIAFHVPNTVISVSYINSLNSHDGPVNVPTSQRRDL